MIKIYNAQPADFPELTSLRHRLIHDDRISKMGRTFLRYYYFPLFFYSKDGILIVSKNEREKITGYVAGSLDFNRLGKFVNIKIATGLLLCCISRPHLIIETILLKAKKSTLTTDLSGYGRLSSLVVSEKFQGKGIGEKLTKAFLDRLGESHIKYCYLSCRSDNNSALKLYKKVGFQESEKYLARGSQYILMTTDNIVSKNNS